MREGGKILATILQELEKITVVGISTMDLEKKAEKLCNQYNVIPGFRGYHGYPYILCTSINENVVHTFPKEKDILKEGDLINIDCGLKYKDFYVDAAVTVLIPPQKPALVKFKKTVEQALYEGINIAKAGHKIGEISATIQYIVEKAGYSIIKELVGHGVGRKLHEFPQVPNYGIRNEGPMLKEGMTLAIEPIVSMGRGEVKTLENGWDIVTVDGSISCQIEHTILITKNDPEILTNL